MMRDIPRNVTDLLMRLAVCATIAFCVITARDTFIGVAKQQAKIAELNYSEALEKSRTRQGQHHSLPAPFPPRCPDEQQDGWEACDPDELPFEIEVLPGKDLEIQIKPARPRKGFPPDDGQPTPQSRSPSA